MEKSKLFSLLVTFDGYEWRNFLTFLESTYFNRKPVLVHLAGALREYAEQGEAPAREILFRQAFPRQPYREAAFNHQLSELQALAERFLALRRFEQEGIFSDYLLLKEYVDRRQVKAYDHALRRAQKRLDDYPQRDEQYLRDRFLLADLAEEHFSRQQVRRYDPTLQEASDALDAFFLVKKLKYLCAILDRRKILTGTYEQHLMEEIKQYLDRRDFRHEPAVHLYHLLLLIQTEEPAGDHFQAFRQALRDHRDGFSTSENRDLYYFAINFCIQRLRFGEKQYAEELMQLYLEGTESGVLLEGGTISPWTFKNMVKLGLGLERFAWVAQFIHQYAEKLPPSQQRDAYHFNLAELHYHRQNYNGALEHLNQVEFSDIHYSLGAKVILLKIYYETETVEALLSLLSSFRLYLKRNRHIPREVKMPYLNFITFLQKLHRQRPAPPPHLADQIRTMPQLTERSWLLRQVEEGHRS